MRNGTQEELDVSKPDARLIPHGVKFKISKKSTAWNIGSLDSFGYKFGDIVYRTIDDKYNANDSVGFIKEDNADVVYFAEDDLEPIK